MHKKTISSFYPSVPVEIVRIIFELAALLSPRTAAKLCLVSKTVLRWVERALYHTVILRRERNIMAFARAINYRNDPTFFATHVKTLCFGSALSGLVRLTDKLKAPDVLSLISSTCTGIERLGYGLTSHVLEAAVFADASTRFSCLTHLSMLDFNAYFLRLHLPPQITHLHLECYQRESDIIHVDWVALFRRCTRLTHLFLSGPAWNDSLATRYTQLSVEVDFLEVLPIIACLPPTLSMLVISVIPNARLITLALPQTRNCVKRILDSDERILMISPRSFYRGLIDGLYCCEGSGVSTHYGPQWEHSEEEDDMWEFAERCFASRKRTQGGMQL